MNKEQDETDVCMLIDTKVFFKLFPYWWVWSGMSKYLAKLQNF